MRAVLIIITLSLFTGAYAGVDQALYQQGNRLYAEGRYQEAIEAYKKASQGAESPEICFNLGNAYYKSKDLAHAILYYEKALKLNPAMRKARENLEIANARIPDKIEPSARQSIGLMWTNFKKETGVETFSMLSLALWMLGGISLALFMWSSRPGLKKVLFFTGLGMVLSGLVTLRLSCSTLEEYTAKHAAIITVPRIDVKSEPTENGSNVFILHEGTKVTILRKSGNWNEVSIASGNIGWLPAKAVEEI